MPLPALPSLPDRSARRRWLAALLLVCLLGLGALAFSHHHEDALAEDGCAVCHVVLHQALDCAVPQPTLGLALLFFLYLLVAWQPLRRAARLQHSNYHSRAPPEPFR